jgi:hypothetical protein
MDSGNTRYRNVRPKRYGVNCQILGVSRNPSQRNDLLGILEGRRTQARAKMKDFIPDAPFDFDSQPVGDVRWWYSQFYRQHDLMWNGPAPDKYSPHTRDEEVAIEKALLDGTLQPRSENEKRYLDFMEGPWYASVRPKKWVVCHKCGVEWQSTGYPAGLKLFQYNIGLGEAVDDFPGRWFFPNRCTPCDDRIQARVIRQGRLPYKD